MTAEQQVDHYLAAFRIQLGPIAPEDREEFVREIRAHIRDSAEQTGVAVSAILTELGTPKDLAAQYRDGLLIRQASRSLSPAKLMRGALRLATKGVSGVTVFLLGMFGYAMGGGFVLSGLLKPILPANTGVWINEGHLVSFGTLFPRPVAPAYEVLGMWYILLALTLGSTMILLTSFLIRTMLRVSQTWQSMLHC